MARPFPMSYTPSSGTAASSTPSSRQPPWADVTGVEVSGSSGNYTFDVTFHSTDIDCSEYADWWEVLTEDGDLVYRRILAHPHTPGLSGNPVARSGGPVDVTPNQIIIVRAHLNTVGYVGIPMRGTVNNGFEPAPDIDGQFAPDVASLDPQPGECVNEQGG